MLNWYTLPITLPTALLNRLWRGEGTVPKWVWFATMVVLAVALSGQWSAWQLYVIWFIYFYGYAGFAWQAMFSTITGTCPGRKDVWYLQWMQDLAYKICHMDPNVPCDTYSAQQWRVFGMVYGAIRATLEIPGILLLCWWGQSYVPLSGLAGLLMGVVYYEAWRLSEHWTQDTGMAVPLAEMCMGW
ncbi:MAG: hypothetical protein EBV03_13565, partial [Proteobacteria bacterium]|nr:hypothetical protein [Pseudomonadota bacterium]